MATLNIEDELMNRQRQATVMKHGKLRGALQDEVTKAISSHLIHMQRPPSPSTASLLSQVPSNQSSSKERPTSPSVGSIAQREPGTES